MDIDKEGLRKAALALQAAVAAFDPGESAEAQSVRGFCNRTEWMEAAIAGQIDEPFPPSIFPNASRGLDGALQGYPQLESAYYAFTNQLQGLEHMRRMAEIIRKWQESRQAAHPPS